MRKHGCILFVVFCSVISTFASRTFTIVNRSNQTLWIGTLGFVGSDCATPFNPGNGGFALSQGASRKISVPGDWCAGRIWARTKCRTHSSGKFVCETGDCGPTVQCQHGGEPPATLAEFTLQRPPSASD